MKLAILGTGFIVKEGALKALKDVPEIETVAIFARPKSKGDADALAAAYSIPKVYTDYDELLANPDIDFVYIGLFGAPESVNYTANLGFNGIDTSGVATLKYPGFFALAIGAKDTESPGFATIQGEKGWIRVTDAPNELRFFETHVRGTGITTHNELNRYGHRMVHEFQEFAKAFHEKAYDCMAKGLDVSVAVLETAEAARKQVGIVFPCDGPAK